MEPKLSEPDRGREDLSLGSGARDLEGDGSKRDFLSDPGVRDLLHDLGVRETILTDSPLRAQGPTELHFDISAARGGRLALVFRKE
jgi:hypothetical protein